MTARVDPSGEWTELSDAAPATVVVPGYTGAPYLRTTFTRTKGNELSRTRYLSRALFADSVRTGQTGQSTATSSTILDT